MTEKKNDSENAGTLAESIVLKTVSIIPQETPILVGNEPDTIPVQVPVELFPRKVGDLVRRNARPGDVIWMSGMSWIIGRIDSNKTIELDGVDIGSISTYDALFEMGATFMVLAPEEIPDDDRFETWMRGMCMLTRKIAAAPPMIDGAGCGNWFCRYCGAPHPEPHIDGCPWVLAKMLDQMAKEMNK